MPDSGRGPARGNAPTLTTQTLGALIPFGSLVGAA